MLGEEENRVECIYIALRLTTASLLRLFKSNEFVAAALACIRNTILSTLCMYTYTFAFSIIIIKYRS